MARFDDGESSQRIPLFQAAAILIVVIALLGVLADRFMSSDDAPGSAARLPAQAETVLAGAPPAAPSVDYPAELLQHWESLLPVIGELERAWTARDAPALRMAHDDLVRSIERLPLAPANASEAERAYQVSYREALVYLEDGVDDLREGLEIPDPAEWEEGMLDARTARVRLDAVVERIRSGR